MSSNKSQKKPKDVKRAEKKIGREIKDAIKSVPKQVRKAAKEERPRRAERQVIGEIAQRGTFQSNQARYFKSVFTRRDAARLAWMLCVSDPFDHAAVPIPPLLTPGVSTSCPRMYPICLRGTALANSTGSLFIGVNADGWFPNASLAAGAPPQPGYQYLGNSTANGGTRGYPVHYTNAAYIGSVAVLGVNSTGKSYPSPATTAGAGVAGLQFLQLPDNFIDVQTNQNPVSNNASQRYSCVAAGLRVRPVAPASGALVPQGVLLMTQQILGDTFQTNPAAANSNTAVGGIDCYAYMSGLVSETGGVGISRVAPLNTEMVARVEWDMLEWPHEEGNRTWLTGAAVPNQSCSYGCWTPPQTGSNVVGYPQIAVIGQSMLANQAVEFEAKLVYAYYGGVSYQENQTKLLPAVPLSDLHSVSSAAAAHMTPGAPNPRRAAVAAVSQSAVDEGRVHPKAAVEWIKSGADAVEAVTGSTVGDLIGEGLGFLGSLLL